MITKQDIKRLQGHQDYPCVSLFIPTHKTMPERMQDPIRVKDVMKAAIEKLSSEFKKEEMVGLTKALKGLEEKIDYAQSLEGLALFVSPSFAEAIILPFEATQKIVIDKIFATKDLIKGMITNFPYWVLSVSQKPSRLFKAQGSNLAEIMDAPELVQNMLGFPFQLNYEVVSDRKLLAYGTGDLDSQYLTEQLKQFMHQLDDLLSKKINDEELPLVIIGTEKNRAEFERVTKFKKNIIMQIEGDYTSSPSNDIENILAKEMASYLEKQDIALIAELEEERGKNNFVASIKDVWRQAHLGKVRKLFVEENYQAPAYVDEENPDEVIVYDTSNVPGGYKDLVEDIVSKVFHSKGTVHFLKDGSLSKYEKIAAILWF